MWRLPGSTALNHFDPPPVVSGKGRYVVLRRFARVRPDLTAGWRVTVHNCRVLQLRTPSGFPCKARIFSNHSIAEIARCVAFFHRRSGWFDGTWFKCSELPQTFSNYSIAEIARCVEFFHMRSGWFAYTEPSLPTSLQWKRKH